MQLSQIVKGLNVENVHYMDKPSNSTIKGVAENSAEVKNDYMFVAINGSRSDGHDYIKSAIINGASVVVGEKNLYGLAVPYIKVNNSRKALGIIARNFYGNPSMNKLIIGVTGTNGKTTVTHLIKHILEKNGLTCSMIGTIKNVINREVTSCINTTPSSLVLHKLLSTSNDDVVIMEVSSHGLKQFRVEGIQFDFCLFTNLDRDHLDYHTSMDEYFKTKSLLFDKLRENGQAIINTDNQWGEKLENNLKSNGRKPFTIGTSENRNLEIIDFCLKNSTIKVNQKHNELYIYSPMPGIHNMYNALMAYGVATLIGLGKNEIISSMYDFTGVEGRFEIVKLDNDITVVIDYAHTADAFSQCLKTARLYGAKRLTHIFGFRGNRDISKRKEMLSVSARLSDQYILTLDDLNSVTIKEMMNNMEHLQTEFGNDKGLIIEDRTIAIKRAMEQCIPGDWIVITGKGHEKYREPYYYPTQSDKETVIYTSINKEKKCIT